MFEGIHQDAVNLLPCDGEAALCMLIAKPIEKRHFFETLMQETAWQNERLMMFGRLIVTARKSAWYGEEGLAYSYTGFKRSTLPWTPTLLKLKTIIEEATSQTFNSCLLNLYHSGKEGMSWHSDDEKELGVHPAIASLSLGAERKFSFKHKLKNIRKDIMLPDGSLLLMSGACQERWKHALPVSKKIKDARINLTFRQIIN